MCDKEGCGWWCEGLRDVRCEPCVLHELTGHVYLYTGLWKVHNRHVFCIHLQPQVNWRDGTLQNGLCSSAQLLCQPVIPQRDCLQVETEALIRSRLTTEITYFLWYGLRRKAYTLLCFGVNCSCAWRSNRIAGLNDRTKLFGLLPLNIPHTFNLV
jgi:hypothetical protein